MILQTRDRELLSSLSRYGILSSEQIGELFFKGVCHTTMMKRLRMLEEANFILRARGLPDSRTAWYLSTKGAKEINAPEPSRYTNQNIIIHEVNLSALRLVLESMGIGEDFTSESDLRRQYKCNRNDEKNAERLIPDGIFVAPKNGKSYVVALELEIQPKNHARLKKSSRSMQINRPFTSSSTAKEMMLFRQKKVAMRLLTNRAVLLKRV